MTQRQEMDSNWYTTQFAGQEPSNAILTGQKSINTIHRTLPFCVCVHVCFFDLPSLDIVFIE